LRGNLGLHKVVVKRGNGEGNAKKGQRKSRLGLSSSTKNVGRRSEMGEREDKFNLQKASYYGGFTLLQWREGHLD